jgi:hypothetical protein
MSPAAATWTPPESPIRPVVSDLDGWDDDLGWEGVESTAPETREAWEQWRATESPLASTAASEAAAPAAAQPEPELPSVERWRARAEEADWVEDDDGLGWEGEQDGAGSHLWNGPGPEAESSGSGRAWAPEPGVWNGAGQGRDWSRDTGAPPARDGDPAPAFAASASAATDVAPEPALGRTISLEDDGWDPPVSHTWGAGGVESVSASKLPNNGSGPARRRQQRTSRMHPVLLVAIYAAAGIGIVVLASTALLGGSSDPAPASVKATPTAEATASATPEVSGTPAAATASDEAAEKAAAAAAAAERQARTTFGRERSSALRSHSAQVSKARSAARRKAKAVERSRNSSPSSPAPASTPAAPTYTAPSQPAPTYRAPTPRRRSVCEFCIG